MQEPPKFGSGDRGGPVAVEVSTTPPSFDRFARDYGEVLDKSVSISGESGEYFSEYKARYVARHVKSLTVEFWISGAVWGCCQER